MKIDEKHKEYVTITPHTSADSRMFVAFTYKIMLKLFCELNKCLSAISK